MPDKVFSDKRIPFGFENIEVTLEILVPPVIADHLDDMTQLLQMVNHLTHL